MATGSPHPITEFPRYVQVDVTGTPTAGGAVSSSQLPETLGTKTAAASVSITHASDDPQIAALIVAVNELLTDLELRASPLGITIRDPDTGLALDVDEDVPVRGWGFDVAVALTVAATTHTALDVVGGLLTFPDVAPADDMPIIITGVQVVVDTAITPALKLVLFNAVPATIADDAAYTSLAASDVKKSFKTIDFTAMGGAYMDHGTPNSISVDNLGVVCKPITGTRDIHGYLVDTTGVAWASNGAQVRIRGVGA